jgi:hypothetical protein
MRKSVSLLVLTVLLGRSALATDAGYSFDITINDNDASTTHLAATVPNDTSHTLQVNKHLIVELNVTDDNARGVQIAQLVDTAGGAHRQVAVVGRRADSSAVFALSFSECGDRAITMDHPRPIARPQPGRCADLPAMAKPDQVLGECRECAGAYEEMPAVIGPHTRIARPNELGEPLIVVGGVFGVDGRPRRGVIVYAYQADHFGHYPSPEPPRSDASQYEGTLRGWARTDAHGRYRFDTIRPGAYGDNPQHIHMLVIEPGCSTYYIDEINFTDDPVYQGLTEEHRRFIDHHWGGTGVVTPVRKGPVWTVSRDIHLGENIPGYKECPVIK